MQRLSQLPSRTKAALFSPPLSPAKINPLHLSALTSVLRLHVHYKQGQVAVASWQQGFDPALLTGLVLRGKLVRPQPRLAPHQREGEVLLGLAQLDGAALQNNHSDQIPVGLPVFVEEEVPLQHEPALLIGSLDLTLCVCVCDSCVLLTAVQTPCVLNFLHNWFEETGNPVGGEMSQRFWKLNLKTVLKKSPLSLFTLDNLTTLSVCFSKQYINQVPCKPEPGRLTFLYRYPSLSTGELQDSK